MLAITHVTARIVSIGLDVCLHLFTLVPCRHCDSPHCQPPHARYYIVATD